MEDEVERHFISRAPVLNDILRWAGEQGLDNISEGHFAAAVGPGLTEEHQLIVNSHLWGFLSAAVSGTAGTFFKGAHAL